MTATIHQLHPDTIYTIDVSTPDRRAVGSFDTGAETGICISQVEIGVVEPAWLSGGPRGTARIVGVGTAGRQLLERALAGPLSMRCRAVPEGMKWRILEVVA